MIGHPGKGGLLGRLLITLLLAAGLTVVASSPAFTSAGDGQWEPEAGEQCDDGNFNDGDGCSGIMLIEPGWGCRHEPGQTSSCYPAGDGVISYGAGEQCDDGAADDEDGCDRNGQIEPGWDCGGAPSVCHPVVTGNGLVERGEDCDDLNTQPGDGCDEEGLVEAGWACTGEPSVCTLAKVENLTLPSITGTAQVGSSLTAWPGEWRQNDLTFAYRWYVGGEPVGPFSSLRKIRVETSYVGKRVVVKVKATKLGYVGRTVASVPTDRVVR